MHRFHPSGILINFFDRLADHPSVVGIKLTHSMSAGLAYELCDRLSDRLLMGPVNLDPKAVPPPRRGGLLMAQRCAFGMARLLSAFVAAVVRGRLTGRGNREHIIGHPLMRR